MGGGTKTPEYKAKFPIGQIPALEDGEFCLVSGLHIYKIGVIVPLHCILESVLCASYHLQSEGSAMMQYLCEKYKWDQWWPQGSDDAARQKRAKLSEYMSYHHHGTRMISHKVAFKLFYKQFFKKDYPETKEELKELSLKYIANFEKKGLSSGPFIAGSTTPTIADLFAYAEIYQLVYMGLLMHQDLSPAMQTWSEAMQALPAHDDVHRSIEKLGGAIRDADAGTVAAE